MVAPSVLNEPIGIIGAGVAGLINAHVLLQDGFTDVTLISRDKSVGGTWARHRVYPGLYINKYVPRLLPFCVFVVLKGLYPAFLENIDSLPSTCHLPKAPTNMEVDSQGWIYATTWNSSPNNFSKARQSSRCIPKLLLSSGMKVVDGKFAFRGISTPRLLIL